MFSILVGTIQPVQGLCFFERLPSDTPEVTSVRGTFSDISDEDIALDQPLLVAQQQVAFAIFTSMPLPERFKAPAFGVSRQSFTRGRWSKEPWWDTTRAEILLSWAQESFSFMLTALESLSVKEVVAIAERLLPF